MNEPKYPSIVIHLAEEGNIYVIGGRVTRALKHSHGPPNFMRQEIERFHGELAASQSYAEAVDVLRRWVTVIEGSQYRYDGEED